VKNCLGGESIYEFSGCHRISSSQAWNRIKELIIVGGYNVYPVEVENVIYQHPAVLEAAVISVPDKRLGENPKAFIVQKKGYNVT
jgi:long-chain acyl-CoA synthetase